MNGILFRGRGSDPETLEEVIGQTVALSCIGQFDYPHVQAIVHEAVTWIRANFAAMAPTRDVPMAPGLRGEIFDRPQVLDDHLHELNLRRGSATAVLFDSAGHLWLTRGRRTPGADAITCWLTGGHDDPLLLPLDAAEYPVVELARETTP